MTTDRETTQDHMILNCLADYTGQRMTVDVIEKIYNKIKQEMRTGSCSWAFGEGENNAK